MVMAPISALLIKSLLGNDVPFLRVFNNRGKPLAPVPPNIELMIKIYRLIQNCWQNPESHLNRQFG